MSRPCSNAVALAGILAVVVAPGCRRAAPRPSPSQAATPAISIQTYPLKGVVRHVDAGAGRVTIRHEAVPGFMDAMTMPFTVKEHSLLEDVRAGDEVEGTLRVEKERGEVKDYELTDLAVSRPAPPAPLSLNLSGGSPALVPSPKVLEPGDVVPDFAMTDQDGHALRLSDLRGKVVALTFIYTRCPLPDFCPALDRKFAEASERAAAVPGRADHLRFLSVSFDPEHDTPEVLARHARTQGARPPLRRFAVAPHDELAKVARPLGLTYGPTRDEIIHNLTVAVIGPDGRLARLQTGNAARAWPTADFLKAMYSLIRPSRD